MATKKAKWVFPEREKEFSMMRIELVTLTLVSLIVLIFSYLNLDSFVQAIIFTALFVAIYLVVDYFVQLVYRVEQHYHLHGTHLEHTTKRNKGSKKIKIPLRDIVYHKLDDFFLGGYVVTKDGKKHLLFFNNPQELRLFKSGLKGKTGKVSKSKKVKSVKKRKR